MMDTLSAAPTHKHKHRTQIPTPDIDTGLLTRDPDVNNYNNFDGQDKSVPACVLRGRVFSRRS